MGGKGKALPKSQKKGRRHHSLKGVGSKTKDASPITKEKKRSEI